MGIELRRTDTEEISSSFPGLHVDLNNQRIWGTLSFGCWYDTSSKELVHDPIHTESIKDDYEIVISFCEQDTFGFPIVREPSEKISDFAKSEGLELSDLHMNKDDESSCCLGIFPEYHWVSPATFIRDKVLPYFFWQSFRRIHGVEPWKCFEHGLEGIHQALIRPLKQIEKGCYTNKPCPCGSGKKYKKCCKLRDQKLSSILRNASSAKARKVEKPLEATP